jgi:putative tryptophan/tyrosine transport system substrate-binding protein
MLRAAMRRRDFITLLGGATITLPLSARAAAAGKPIIGVLGVNSSPPMAPYTAWFVRGLNEAGFAEGQNVVIEYRWAEGDYDRLAPLAAELAEDHVAVIYASGGAAPLRAAMAATSTIPIIFSLAGDPVKLGVVSSLNRPGGNVTGVTFTSVPLGAKRLELIRELVPNARRIAVLVNPNSVGAADDERQLEAITNLAAAQLLIINASSVNEINAAFASLLQQQADVLLIPPDGLMSGWREQLVALAAQYAIPTVYFEREFVVDGGLISYGTPLRDSYRQAGIYAGRILGGAKPVDLPIVQATKFELVLNLKTAKTLGLKVPQTLLVAADEIIE